MITYIFLGILAACVGSFLNVVIYRYPKMLERDWKFACQEYLNIKPSSETASMNLCLPRSFCPQCQQTIPIWWNIPIMSYCLLRGKCRFCQQSISPQYPIVEMLSLVLSLLAAYHFGWTITLIPALGIIWLLIPLFFIDLQTQLLPDSLNYSLLWLGLLANTQACFAPLSSAVYGAVIAYLFLWILSHIFWICTKKQGLGGGDLKLLAALGACFGWQLLPFLLLCSAVTGLLGGGLYLLRTKQNKDTPFAFGPYLCVAGCIALFAKEEILFWYFGGM
ncbi:MAG: A24 family peptidase [Legionellaceae bacterium]|nr:A24 family peptidase [Legionellaceae bacterium]